MARFRTSWVVAAVGVTVLVSPWKASAAHLEEFHKQVDKHASPPAADLAPGAPACLSDINQSINVLISPDGQQASADLVQTIDEVGQLTTCNFNDTATESVDDVFTVVPDAGDSLGGDVLFCFTATFQEAASATGNYIAQSTIGDRPLTGAARIIRNPSGTAVTEFSFGPVSVMQNAAPVHQSFTGEFGGQIGDQIEIDVGQGSAASGSGVGSAHTNASSAGSLSIGACAVPAPALSRNGLGVLVLLLAVCGAISARLSRNRRGANGIA
jgi:hypothetical protein